ncbi:cation transporter [Brachyspira hyodysenteriae]|uniref:TrkH family potassium uptake protein n=1 Tax=Brachyspira hyodysenteriae TaxID=159 RepID=UPI0022CD6432|nr:potassium transporter TrkG [Brachyspira hyodysenteriae]MCZ9850498.1 cation transporter [Brachyspira hyodysenteriae]MCZ9860750.1 cation transporter [Brachyspira hyodysenteriae]MCZ9869750.1 cation transporter [Brachyspira hyodysenteriae]MCZ9875824.1 cation transporter [Brachyspira hyodysenteriae]MCZ9895393.1 cation transporter [Brachyspira hyodysenteriae]
MKNIFNNKLNNQSNPNKTFIQAIDEFLRRISNLVAIAGSIFAIFVLLMQVRQINVYNFYISNYDKIINIITICFVFILIDQIRIAPRKLYIVVPIIQLIGLLLLNFFSRKYYDVYANRIIWTIAGSILFFLVIVINWLRLSYSKFTLYQMIIASFIFVITLGSLLLYLPLSTVTGKLSFVDALFTATSAVCVTGLSVIDVSKEFTLFGQIVLIALIQIGGLGIMSISAIVLLFSVSKGSVQDRVRTLEMFNTQNKDIIQSTIKVIFLSTFFIELLGAVSLFTVIDTNDRLGMRIFSSVFHSISAFCNAGFSLYTDNLHQYSANVVVNVTIMLLITLGGIGYPVMLTVTRAIINKFKGKRYVFDVQARIVIFTSILLIIIGSVFIFFNEYSNSLKDLPLKEKILVSLFQSVSPRTAGFETIAYNSMSSVTIGVVIFLMFVGASPNSTGGGVKTTTLFVFIFSVITAIFNRPYIVVNGRKIKVDAVNKSVAIVTLAITISVLASFIMFYIEKSNSMMPILFEVISAISTVGLSLGITPTVTVWSKLILIVLMFIGRVGYLTLFMSIGSINQGKYGIIDLPTGEVTIG